MGELIEVIVQYPLLLWIISVALIGTFLFLVNRIESIDAKNWKVTFRSENKPQATIDPKNKLAPTDGIVSKGSKIEGRRLFEYEGYYPVDIEPGSNLPTLNSQIFLRAVHYFTDSVNDKLAAMDLVYLREDNRNHIRDPLPAGNEATYEKLLDKYELQDFRRNFSAETERLFRNITKIVHDVGDTLQGVSFEILLHNVRNPLRSIIAVKNSHELSGRRLFGPSTRFVVQYVKHQGKHLIEAMESGSKVAYPKQFTKTKEVKATTTPIYDDRYGLIGILCFNINVEAINNLDEHGKDRFFLNYVKTHGETPLFEKDEAPDD